MPKNATFGNGLLLLIFNGTTLSGLAMNTTTSPLTSLFISLHTADPTTAGNQASSEITYTSYARAQVARSSAGFTVTGETVAFTSTVSFPAGTGGTGTAAFVGIGSALTGTGSLFYTGTITPNIVCGNGITPQLTTATAITES